MFETLENRQMLSGTTGTENSVWVDSSKVLHINGSNSAYASDIIVVQDELNTEEQQVWSYGQNNKGGGDDKPLTGDIVVSHKLGFVEFPPQVYQWGEVNGICINGMGGNDLLAVDTSLSQIPATIQGGSGNDLMFGGLENDTFNASGGNSAVTYNADVFNDTVKATPYIFTGNTFGKYFLSVANERDPQFPNFDVERQVREGGVVASIDGLADSGARVPAPYQQEKDTIGTGIMGLYGTCGPDELFASNNPGVMINGEGGDDFIVGGQCGGDYLIASDGEVQVIGKGEGNTLVYTGDEKPISLVGGDDSDHNVVLIPKESFSDIVTNAYEIKVGDRF